MNSLKSNIAKHLKGLGWVNGGEIERYSIELGYKASNGSRRCRDLVNEGILARKIEKGSVWYRMKQSEIVERINAMPPKKQKETQSNLL